MKNRIFFLLIVSFTTFTVKSSTISTLSFLEEKLILHTKTGEIYGVITTPLENDEIPIAIIIAGSGPTDRDGNNPMMKNNSLKILAAELSKTGIATLRFDKRGIGESIAAGKSEIDLRFDDYVNDVKEWIQLIKQDKRFSKIILIGHSEGSLIGMFAAENVDKYISVAGAGQSADKIIKEQLGSQPKEIQDLCFPMIDSLKNGKLIENVPSMLNSLFRPSVQPYMISWFKHDPISEIEKLSIPILILQGTNDIQISIEEAKRLSSANSNAELVIIKNMNHILRIIDGDIEANIKTYSNSELPISIELVKSISNFIFVK